MYKIIVILLIVSLTGCWETQQGEKIGTIVKFAQEGAIVKTWEAELIRGGMSSGSGSFGRPFDFTVENKNLIPLVEKALNDQKEVKIKYHKEAATWFRAESENYFLDDIEIL